MTFHFYLNHRLLRWPPLYHVAHALHHRNVNTGPWTGISMHPLEHLIYFSLLLLWWVVPVHPVVVVLTGFYQGISPAVSHSGFDQVVLGGGTRVSAGDLFHGSFVPGCMVVPSPLAGQGPAALRIVQLPPVNMRR